MSSSRAVEGSSSGEEEESTFEWVENSSFEEGEGDSSAPNSSFYATETTTLEETRAVKRRRALGKRTRGR